MGAICRHFGPHHRYEDVRSLSAAQRTSEEVRLRAGSRGDSREGTTWQEVSVPIISEVIKWWKIRHGDRGSQNCLRPIQSVSQQECSESRRCSPYAVREQTRHGKQERSGLARILAGIQFVIPEREFQQPGTHHRPYLRRARRPVAEGQFPADPPRVYGRKPTDTASRPINCRYLEPS